MSQGAGSDEEVRTEDSITNAVGPSSLGNLVDNSQVSTRLGISINLSLLQRQPSTPAVSSISCMNTASWVDPFVEPVGPTQTLPFTSTATDFLQGPL